MTERDIIRSGIASLGRDLNSLRNAVVHDRATEISTEQAIEYVDLALRTLRIVNYLRSVPKQH